MVWELGDKVLGQCLGWDWGVKPLIPDTLKFRLISPLQQSLAILGVGEGVLIEASGL
jgi:hypothetical protein